MVLLIGNVDYSNHVIAGSYNSNQKIQSSKWDDANYRTHKFKQRDKIVGSFDMFFRTVTDYEGFKADLDDAQAPDDDSYSISLTVNNISEQRRINAFIDYELVRDIDGKWQDYFGRFTVNIEER
jgi:hypothetical protein